MGRIVVTEFVSLDGVVEAPGGEPGYAHTNWVGERHHDSWQEYKQQEIADSDALLLGRVTYESFAGAWPDYEGDMADRMNALPKYVVSTTLTSADWNNTTVLSGDLRPEVEAVKARHHGEIQVAGSRTLVNALKALDLVDEYHFMVFPVVLGSGARLFDEVEQPYELSYRTTRPFDNGVVVHTYVRSRT
ncbi:MAG: dihydrofolate reductase family protein [Candidatus Nanopelagicales bacterium]|nr:dihydrofolate reductase family protein [Candidatus Nanopelagicales bacterium]